MCLSPRSHQPLRGSDLGLGYELGLSVYCPVMHLPQSSLNPMCTHPDVLLYILLFPCFKVARILKRFVTRHERIDAPVSVVLCLPAHLRVSTAASRGQPPHGNASAVPTPYSHTEGRLLPYDAEAAPVQHCLWAAVTAAQDEPSLAPWLGPAEQHAYGSMPAAAMDKVFKHLHATHDALARVVGRWQPSPAGTDPAEGDPPESGKRLQAAFLCYDALVACAPAVYQADAVRHGIRSQAALRLAEELRGALPGFRPTTQGQLQEELERRAAALEEDIRQLRALLAADRKRAIKDFWRRQAPDIAQRWKDVREAIEVEAPGPSGLWNVRVPNTQTLLTGAHDVLFAVGPFSRELYDKRPVDLPGFQAVLSRHVPGSLKGPGHRSSSSPCRTCSPPWTRPIARPQVPTKWRPVSSRPSRHPSSGSADALEGRAHLAQPQGTGLRQTGRLQAHRPEPAGREAAHEPPHPAHHRSAHTARTGQRLAARGPPWLQHRPPTVHGAAAAPAGKAQLRFLLRRPQGLRHRPARRPPPHPAPPLRAAGGHRPPALPPHVRQAVHGHRTRANAARLHAARRPAGQPREPPAVRAPPGAPAQGAGAPPAPAGRGRARPHPGLHRRPAGGGPHAAALRRGRGRGGRIPGDDGMELNPRKCAMATTEGVPGLQLRLCPHLETPWHWVPAADSVPYLGLQLQPDGELSLQSKHQLRLAAVHHWCLNTLAPPKVVQDVILAILGGVTQYVAPFIAYDSDTARHLDHITVQVTKDRARYTFDASRDSLRDDPDPGAHTGANPVPAGSDGPRGYTRPPPLNLRARPGHQDVLGNSRRTA